MILIIAQILLRKPMSSLLKPAVSLPRRRKPLSGRALEVRKTLCLVDVSPKVVFCELVILTQISSLVQDLIINNLICIVPSLDIELKGASPFCLCAPRAIIHITQTATGLARTSPPTLRTVRLYKSYPQVQREHENQGLF